MMGIPGPHLRAGLLYLLAARLACLSHGASIPETVCGVFSAMAFFNEKSGENESNREQTKEKQRVLLAYCVKGDLAARHFSNYQSFLGSISASWRHINKWQNTWTCQADGFLISLKIRGLRTDGRVRPEPPAAEPGPGSCGISRGNGCQACQDRDGKMDRTNQF